MGAIYLTEAIALVQYGICMALSDAGAFRFAAKPRRPTL